MEFNKKDALVVPFNMSEDDIRQNFLDWIILGDNTPIDAAYRSNITSVKKKFYPIRIVKAKYTASWSATSTWEHEEEYTEQVLYIKYQYGYSTDGRPSYGTMKAERYYENNHYGPCVDKFYKPEKKKKTVVDNVERTDGKINGEYSQKVITVEDNNADFIKWLDSISIEDKIKSTDLQLKNSEIMPLIENDDYAKDAVAPNIRKKSKEECEKKVPGTRYEDFKVDDIKSSFKIEIVMLPVYELEYEYENKKYTAWFSGSVKDSVFSIEKPEDAELASKKDVLDKEIEDKKSARLKSGWIGFGGGAVVTIILMILASDFWFLVLIPLIIFEVIFVKKDFMPKHNAVKECESRVNIYLGNLKEKRQQVADIVKQDNLSAEEQKAKIKEIIEK